MAGAARYLPDLRSRVRIDSSEIDQTDKKVKQLDKTLRATGDSTKPLETGLDRTFGPGTQRKMQDFGRDMTTKVTLPLAAGAAAALKLSSDFDTTFQQMTGLAGVAASEVEGLKEEVLGLSGETAIGPQELAEALYQIRSSGIPAAEALDVLTVSAKASVTGLGDTAAVADAVTSAMNAYGPEVLDAARATDILFAAVREGKGEADALAPQLGALLPVASELGIEFEEVAGSVAFLTQTGNNAATASTLLNNVMLKLLKPSQQAAEELAKVGLTADDLRRVADEDGLLGVVRLLNEAFGGNKEALARVLEDQQAIVGFYALARDNGDAYASTLDKVAQSQGVVNDAFASMTETEEFAARKALADLLATAIEVGQQLAPILATIAGAASNILTAFNELPDAAQATIIFLGAVAAAIGPIVNTIVAAQKAVKGLQAVASASSGALNTLGTSAGFATVSVAALTAAVALGVMEWKKWGEAGKKAGQELASQTTADVGNDITLARRSIADLVEQINLLDEAIDSSSAPWDADKREEMRKARDELDSEADAMQRAVEQIEELSEATGLTTDELAKWADEAGIDMPSALADQSESVESLTAKIDASSFAQGNLTEAQGETVSLSENVEQAYEDQQDALRGLTDTVLAAYDAQTGYERSLQNVRTELDEYLLATTYAKNHPDDVEAAEAAKDAFQEAEDAIRNQADAFVTMREEQALAAGETYTAEQRVQDYRDELLRLTGQLAPGDPLRDRIAGLTSEIHDLTEERRIQIEIQEALERIALLRRVIEQFQTDFGGSVGQAAPGFGNSEREGGGVGGGLDTDTDPNRAGLRMPAPRLAMPAPPTVAGTEGVPAVQIVVNGQPDATTLDRLRRTAVEAVEQGWTAASRRTVRTG